VIRENEDPFQFRVTIRFAVLAPVTKLGQSSFGDKRQLDLRFVENTGYGEK
jgi:hypothetical protein